MFKRFVIAAALAAGTMAPAATMHAATNCQFVLGFATLAGMLPQQVGQCAENEHFNQTNGNEEQASTGGLLVWRKADNWTAFTDGYRTWINGPRGVEQRLNADRLSWEPATPPAPPAAPAPAPSATVPGSPLSAEMLDLIKPIMPPGAQPVTTLPANLQIACYHMAQDWAKLNTGAIVSLQMDGMQCPYMAYQIDPSGKMVQ